MRLAKHNRLTPFVPTSLTHHQVDGVNYFFTSKAEMRKQQAAGEFLEVAPVESFYRGRPLPKRRIRANPFGKGGPLEVGVLACVPPHFSMHAYCPSFFYMHFLESSHTVTHPSNTIF